MNAIFFGHLKDVCLNLLCLLGMISPWLAAMIVPRQRKAWQQRKKRLDPFPEKRRVSLSQTWAAVGEARIDPTPAYYYGEPRDRYTWRSELGSLGVAGEWLVFGMARALISLQLPLSALRWVSCAILEDEGLAGETSLGLILHFEKGPWWDLRVFRVLSPSGVADQLHDLLGVSTNLRDFDLGPADVTLFDQDICGQWEKEGQSAAYLAPDRVLIDWKTALHLADLRTLALGPATGLNQITDSMLRVGYRRADGSLGGLGMQMPRGDAQRWADALSVRTSIPVRVHDGRKGKDEKLAS